MRSSRSSIAEVNFKKLDELFLKPIGIYGSKEEIVRTLREIGSVDVKMSVGPSSPVYRRNLTSNVDV
jgi:hypothetical protein